MYGSFLAVDPSTHMATETTISAVPKTGISYHGPLCAAVKK